MNQIDNFDEDDKLVILNGILGHHGKYEYGSPILLKTVEAQILHLADVTSGDIESIISFSKKGTGGQVFRHMFTLLALGQTTCPLAPSKILLFVSVLKC